MNMHVRRCLYGMLLTSVLLGSSLGLASCTRNEETPRQVSETVASSTPEGESAALNKENEAAYQAYFEQAIKGIQETFEKTEIPMTFQQPVLYEEMVAMRDGVKLETFYILPEEGGSFPVIFQRGCYTQMDPISRATGQELAKRGYAYVFQYCRGTGNSEGEWVPMENERNDGLDALEWLTAQSWAGNIGYTGSSYLAMTGWAIADVVPAQVKSMYLSNYGANRYLSSYRQELLCHDSVTSWAMENAGFPITADYLESCLFRPHMEVDEMLWGQRLDWYRDSISSTKPEDSYWNRDAERTLRGVPENIEIPIHISEGWYDHHFGNAIFSYESLSEKAKAHSQLTIGGWNHFMEPCLESRDTTNLQNDDTRRMLDWFEATLKREELPEPIIRTYQVGGDVWREWRSWPLPSEEQSMWFFSDSEENGAYNLTAEASEGAVSYAYDPEKPVPSHGGEALLHTREAIGSLSQPGPGWREDVVSFLSEPVDKDMEIAGQIDVTLYVSSDAEDTAFTAKVMEVLPDGSAYNIRSTIATIGSQLEEPYTPGQVVRLELPMWDIDWLVHEGSRIRVDISSSDFPQFAVHSNYPGIWSEQEKTKTAVQTIHMGVETPSGVSLPISKGE